MTIFQSLLLLFFLVPLVEIYFLIKVGGIVGSLPTIFLVLFTAVLGAILVRAQGFSTLLRVQSSLERDRLPAIELLEGALIIIAGALLLIPGFITDGVGFILLVPLWRQRLVQWFLKRKGWMAPPSGNDLSGPMPSNRVIEGEYQREDD